MLAAPLAVAEDAVARLDECLRNSPIREGWIARTHFSDACASVWIDGELAHLEDLVLHDAGMDVRAPTRAVTRAHAVLRLRRRIAAAEPGWAVARAGLESLRGAAPARDVLPAAPPAADDGEDDALAVQMAEIDALVDRSSRVLAGEAVRAAERTR